VFKGGLQFKAANNRTNTEIEIDVLFLFNESMRSTFFKDLFSASSTEFHLLNQITEIFFDPVRK